MGSDPQYAKYPDLSLTQDIFTLTNTSSTPSSRQASLRKLQDVISEHKMAPLYRYLAHPIDGTLNTSGEGSARKPSIPSSRKPPPSASILGSRRRSIDATLPWDEALYERLRVDNDKELEGFRNEEEEATEKAGETEVLAAKGKRAEIFARIGDKDKALAAYEILLEKTGILGTRIDIVLAVIRICIFFNDKLLVKKNIERAKALVESGGDWDRRNRLKAYQGLHLVTVRSYNLAAPLLLDSLSTFTSYELCSYSSLVVYAVLAGSVSLKRVDFKSKVVDAPEIRAILGEGQDKLAALSGATSAGPGAGDEEMKDASAATPTPAPAAVNLTAIGSSTAPQEAEASVDFTPLVGLVRSLYEGNYQSFFLALAAVEENFLSQDRYLYEHKGWFVREMRLRGYQQLLQSYRVVGLESMAKAFGISVDFLDRDLAKFIAADRIPCTIDRVNNIIETNRPDDKNKQYTDVVKQGDALITKLQKYGQAVRLRGNPISVAIVGGTGLSSLPSPPFTPLALLPPPTTPWGLPSSPISVLSYRPSDPSAKPVVVAFLARHGLHHEYAPHEVPFRANVACLRKLGVRCAVGFSAVGSLKEEVRPRDFVVPDGLVDWTKGVRPFTFFEQGLVGHISLADPFDPPLSALLSHTISAPNLLSGTTSPVVHSSGTLICIEGPTFSTRSESLIFRSLGCSIINMSAAPEARLFREAEIAYGLVCMSTDYDSWHATNEGVSVEMVMGHLAANGENAKKVVGMVLEALGREENQGVVRAERYKGASRAGAGITKVEGRREEAVERVRWLFDGEF